MQNQINQINIYSMFLEQATNNSINFLSLNHILFLFLIHQSLTSRIMVVLFYFQIAIQLLFFINLQNDISYFIYVIDILEELFHQMLGSLLQSFQFYFLYLVNHRDILLEQIFNMLKCDLKCHLFCQILNFYLYLLHLIIILLYII